jgi:hypothetical protein
MTGNLKIKIEESNFNIPEQRLSFLINLVMRSRNVIFTLIIVVVVLLFVFYKIRFLEPKKKPILNRNPYSIVYSPSALCQMDCLYLNANHVTEVLKRGEVIIDQSDLKARPCPIFAIKGITKSGKKIELLVQQCGSVTKINTLNYLSSPIICNCPDIQEEKISLLKIY